METLILTILSVLAFIGLTYLVSSYLSSNKSRISDTGYKLILCVPEDSSNKLEGIIRRIFLERVPEKLMTDGVVYLMIPKDQKDALKIAETLQKMYPLIVLPDLSHVLYDYNER
ncbi:MAG: hypothetical protein GX957_03315 [Clostridiaceae bacterium]|nr:hypothetical protein [Clostridiaceae bacterium]